MPPEAVSARQAALEILRRVETGGAYASRLLASVEPRFHEDPRDAALLHEIVLGVLRQRAAIDHAIGCVASRPVETIDTTTRIALRIGAYAVLFLDRVPPFAAVDSAVELARTSGARAATGFVNAVMRRIADRGRALLPSEPDREDVAALALYASHPQWWVERVVARRGWEGARRLLEANNAPAATVLRPALRRTSVDELEADLRAAGVTVERGSFVPEALRVRGGSLAASGALRGGSAWVQDEAAQLVPMLFPRSGRTARPRILDLCAAPGAKTLQLADALPEGGRIVATDRHEGRLRTLVENVRRLHLDTVAPVAADMAAAPALRAAFDQVLVDAPCSGTGTLRRRPEIRWRLAARDLPQLTARQDRLLDTAAGLVAPEGALVYSVCSLEPEEGEARVTAFLARHPRFRILDPTPSLPPPARVLVGGDHALRTSPDVGELDGFFAVCLERAP